MAEIEHICLLIDGDTLTGVKVVGDAPGAAGMVRHWDFKKQTVDAPSKDTDNAAEANNEEAAQSNDSEAAAETGCATLANALKAAGTELEIDDGCVLALPSSILISKIITLPAADPDTIKSMVRLQMEKLAPVDGEDLSVASEVITATETSVRLFAVALPMTQLNTIADSLSAADIKLLRIDSSLLGLWRLYTDHIAKTGARENVPAPDSDVKSPETHAIVFTMPSGEYDLIVADNAGPVFARALGIPSDSAELVRELMLSLLDLGAEPSIPAPSSITFVSTSGIPHETGAAIEQAVGIAPQWLDAAELGPAVLGILRRDLEEDHIDIIPDAWRALERESASKGRVVSGVIAALAVWVILAIAYALVPFVIKQRTDAIDKEIQKITPAYRVVADTRTKVRIVRSYEDRSRSLLDVLRMICAEMPDGIVFQSVSYDNGGDASDKKNAGGVKIVGDADLAQTVLAFKDTLDASGVFLPAQLTGPTMDGKRQRFRFEMDSRFNGSEALK